MAALTATRKAPWAEALVLQPPEAQPAVGAKQLKLRVLAAGLAFPDVLSIEGSHGGSTLSAAAAAARLLQLRGPHFSVPA
jgi:NADPH:quinone reductase-like Zn-dependent oxidoreductase